MEIINLTIDKKIAAEIKSLKFDLDLKKEMLERYKISLNDYINYRESFKQKCRSLIPDLYKVKLFHFSEDFLRVHYGKTIPNTL